MKNLATCKPREFFKQTVKIKRAAESWLDATKILEIRKAKPVYPDNASVEEKSAILYQQGLSNLSKIFDAIFEEHPEESLELLALACFVEPEDVDEHSIDEYIVALTEMLNNKAVIGFFGSLVRLGQMNI